jgi:hypothetical protein
MDIEKLVNEYPNDMELGKKVRELYIDGRKSFDTLNEKMKDAKIFESPDGGKTVYVRGWGEDITTRKKVTNQLELFDEIN